MTTRRTVTLWLPVALALAPSARAQKPQEKPVLTPSTMVSTQYGWVILDDLKNRWALVCDSVGNPLVTATADKGRAMSVDKAGDFLATRHLVEDAGTMALYSRNGEKKWERPYRYFSGMALSPNGKYAMVCKDAIGAFTIFSTSDTTQKLPNPFRHMPEQDQMEVLYAADFTADGAVVVLTGYGKLHRYDPVAGRIVSTVEVRSPGGQPMILNGNEYNNHKANSGHTRFATTVFEATDRGPGMRTPWLLVYDDTPRVLRLIRIENTLHDFTFVGNRVLVSLGHPSTHKPMCTLLRDDADSVTVLDSVSNGTFLAAAAADSAIYVYDSAQRGRRYQIRGPQAQRQVDSFPLFKDRTQPTRKHAFVPAE